MASANKILLVLLLVGALIGVAYITIVAYEPGGLQIYGPDSENYMSIRATSSIQSSAKYHIEFHHQIFNDTYERDCGTESEARILLSGWLAEGSINQIQYNSGVEQLAAAAESSTTSWTATVRNAVTGLPIEGATVSIGVESKNTNSEGFCEFKDISLGTYNVAITAPGYSQVNARANVSEVAEYNSIYALSPIVSGSGGSPIGSGGTQPIVDDDSNITAKKGTSMSDVFILIMIGIVSSILAWFITVALGTYIPALLTPAGLSISTSAFGVVIFYVMAVIFGLV
jgi:hypothetical protein